MHPHLLNVCNSSGGKHHCHKPSNEKLVSLCFLFFLQKKCNFILVAKLGRRAWCWTKWHTPHLFSCSLAPGPPDTSNPRCQEMTRYFSVSSLGKVKTLPTATAFGEMAFEFPLLGDFNTDSKGHKDFSHQTIPGIREQYR